MNLRRAFRFTPATPIAATSSRGPSRATSRRCTLAARAQRALLFALLGGFLFVVGRAPACEIKFGVDDTSQGPYPAGATVIFRLRVDLTHNNCPVEMKDTKIEGIGLTILGATPWKNSAPNIWERRIKVTVAPAPDGRVMLSAKRSCDKDGGWGALTIVSTALK